MRWAVECLRNRRRCGFSFASKFIWVAFTTCWMKWVPSANRWRQSRCGQTFRMSRMNTTSLEHTKKKSYTRFDEKIFFDFIFFCIFLFCLWFIFVIFVYIWFCVGKLMNAKNRLANKSKWNVTCICWNIFTTSHLHTHTHTHIRLGCEYDKNVIDRHINKNHPYMWAAHKLAPAGKWAKRLRLYVTAWLNACAKRIRVKRVSYDLCGVWVGVVFSELCEISCCCVSLDDDTVADNGQCAFDNAVDMLTFGSLDVISWKLWNAFRDIIFVARTKSFKYSWWCSMHDVAVSLPSLVSELCDFERFFGDT